MSILITKVFGTSCLWIMPWVNYKAEALSVNSKVDESTAGADASVKSLHMKQLTYLGLLSSARY